MCKCPKAAPSTAPPGEDAPTPPTATLCTSCHISSSPFWQAATVIRLKASVRHAEDPKFAQFLDIIRTRRPTQAEIDEVGIALQAANPVPGSCHTCPLLDRCLTDA